MKFNGLENYFDVDEDGKMCMNQIYHEMFTPLMFVIYNNKSAKLNFNSDSLDYLIKKSDLKQVDDEGWSPLMFAFAFNKSNNLNLNNEQFDYMIRKIF